MSTSQHEPTPPCAVVAHPRFDEQDAAWIESVRKTHDPQAALIRAHFTLVFPAPVSPAIVIAEVREAVVGRKAFSVVFTSAAARRDDSSGRTYVYLLPSYGGEQIVALHDKVYGSALRPHCRPEIPYIPHVTIAQKGSHDECLELAAEFNRRALPFEATIDRIDVISVGAQGIVTVAAFGLEPRRDPRMRRPRGD